MIEPIQMDQGGNTVDAKPAVMAMTYKIKRMGKRPLVFNGSELGMAMSFTPGTPYWYEINILRTTDQHFVLVVKLFFQSPDETDSVRAWECDSFAEVLDALEAYDAADDVRVRVDMDDTGMSAAEMAAWALDLRARALGARTHFQVLVGQLLHDLEAA
jgi:hypothetical protein